MPSVTMPQVKAQPPPRPATMRDTIWAGPGSAGFATVFVELMGDGDRQGRPRETCLPGQEMKSVMRLIIIPNRPVLPIPGGVSGDRRRSARPRAPADAGIS